MDTAPISACGKDLMALIAWHIVAAMQLQEVQSVVITYTAGMASRASQPYEAMPLQGLQPSVITFTERWCLQKGINS